MRYCFDLDGTLCTNTEGEYERAEPIPVAIAEVNRLHAAGHDIVIQTARGATTGIDWRARTEAQLAAWGVRYRALYFGKPTADVYIDDKARSADDWHRQLGIVATPCSTGDGSVLENPAYLETTYSPERAPYGPYPGQLAKHLAERYFGQPGRLLDIGCGRGEYLHAFSALGYRTTGVDISPAAAALAGPGMHVVRADLETEPLPFPEGSFDCVFSKSVVEHLRSPVTMLAKARAALAPGGTAVIMTPSWVHTHWGPFYIDHTHVTPFTAPSLTDAMTLAGFVEVRTVHFHQLPFLWRMPALRPAIRLLAALPLPFRPLMPEAPWPDGLNKLIRFANEVMLLAVGRRPG